MNLWGYPALPEIIAPNKFPRRFTPSRGTKFAVRSGAALRCAPKRVRVPEQPHERFAIATERSFANITRRTLMSFIGQVTRNGNGFKGQIKTLAIRADITIVPNSDKKAEEQPSYRVLCGGVEIGAGWLKRAESSGQEYVSLSFSDPSFGPKKLYANLGRAAGQDDDVFAIIWNPQN